MRLMARSILMVWGLACSVSSFQGIARTLVPAASLQRSTCGHSYSRTLPVSGSDVGASSTSFRSNLRMSAQTVEEDVDAAAALSFVRGRKENIPPLKDVKESDLRVAALGGGNTNFNYKVYSINDSSSAIFVKHAKPFAKGFGESAAMSTIRLLYEAQGMREFSNFGFTVPEVFVLDQEACFLLAEYLDDYEPFVSCLQRGKIELEVAEALGAIMGHCHAGTHRQVIPSDKSEEYKRMYQNKEHFDLWDEHFFPMALSRLRLTSAISEDIDNIAPFGKQHYLNCRSYIEGLGPETIQVLESSVLKVLDCYLNKKETLVHADLHANNVMVKRTGGNLRGGACDLSKARMIDFEKFAYGPPGLDVAQWLTNYVYFFHSASSPTTASRMRQAILASWDSYVDAFRIHSDVQCSKHGICVLKETVDELILDTLFDAVGIMGWWMLSLVMCCPVDVLPIATGKEEEERINGVRRRQLETAVKALLLYSKGPEHVKGIDDLLSILD